MAFIAKDPESLKKSELVDIVRFLQKLLYAVPDADGLLPEGEPEWDPEKEIHSAADFINGTVSPMHLYDLIPYKEPIQNWSPKKPKRRR